ncbi:MAG TPA: substrate-binding domain-containing protein [Actinophytocola sp.]|nr:substrate-binding domain-containing protein [Actinophytocola sp.]
MAWLERGATVATSVLSGLIVAAVVKAVNSGVADGVVILWFALAAIGAGAAVWLAGILLRRRKRPARAFFITSAFREKYYVAAFVQRLHELLDLEHIDLVLKVPDRDYHASAQSRHLVRLADRRREYLGGVIFAAEASRLRGDLITFCRKSRLPVVFTDIEPFDRADDYPENTAYVGYDTGELGALAGQWLVRQLRRTDHPHVLIIASCEHNARQQRCEKVLRAARPDVSITTNDQCAFIRSRAHDAVRSHIRHLDPGQRLDAVFCTNDEMALGAVDALSATPATQATVVIGVDGILEARTLIDSSQSPLRATVVQDTDRLTGEVVNLLLKMRRGDKAKKRTILPGEIYEA